MPHLFFLRTTAPDWMTKRIFPVILIAAWCGSRAVSAEIDQENGDPSGSAVFVYQDVPYTQTFTVGLAGYLDSIQVGAERLSSTVDNLTLSLFTTDSSGLPDVFLRSSMVGPENVVISRRNIGASESLVKFDFSTANLMLALGDRLAMQLSSTTPSSAYYLWQIGHDYDGGQAFSQLAQPRTGDFRFQTYVATVPEPAAYMTLLLGTGVIMLWRGRR